MNCASFSGANSLFTLQKDRGRSRKNLWINKGDNLFINSKGFVKWLGTLNVDIESFSKLI